MAHTAGTSYNTEFSGNHTTITVLVDGGTYTGTVSFTGLSTIRGAQVTIAEPLSVNAETVSIDRVSGTTVVVSEYVSGGTICTQTALDFYLTVIGEY